MTRYIAQSFSIHKTAAAMVQTAVNGICFASPSELSKLSGNDPSTVHRDRLRLASMGIVVLMVSGKQREPGAWQILDMSLLPPAPLRRWTPERDNVIHDMWRTSKDATLLAVNALPGEVISVRALSNRASVVGATMPQPKRVVVTAEPVIAAPIVYQQPTQPRAKYKGPPFSMLHGTLGLIDHRKIGRFI